MQKYAEYSMLHDAVEVQRRELQSRLSERYVERRLGVPDGDDDLIKVIIGPRRCGKSFLAMHLLAQAASRGYLNFDDERLVEVEDYDRLLAAVNTVYGNPRHLLLDEIQHLPKWELFVNRLQRQGYRLLLTGSNAHLLSGELATHLTGRHLPIVLFPFSFAESLSAFPAARTGTELAEALHRYALDGGYPEPLLRDVDRGFYLRTLWDSVLYKDIRPATTHPLGLRDRGPGRLPACKRRPGVLAEPPDHRDALPGRPDGGQVHRPPGGGVPVGSRLPPTARSTASTTAWLPPAPRGSAPTSAGWWRTWSRSRCTSVRWTARARFSTGRTPGSGRSTSW